MGEWWLKAGKRKREKDLLVFVADVVKKDQKALKSDSVNVQNEIVCPNKC